VLPVHHHTGLANHGHQGQLSVGLTQTVVGTCAEDQPVLGLLLGGTADPAIRVEGVGVGVGLLVVACGPHGGNYHGSLGDGDGLADGEILLDEVGDHDDGRAVAKGLLDDSAGVGHVVKHFHGSGEVAVTVADIQVLLAHLVEDLGAVSHQLEQPGRGRTGGVLGSEEEGEDSLGDFVIREFTENLGRLFRRVDLDSLGDLLTVRDRVQLGLNPGVHDTRDLATSGHAGLGLGGTLGELSEHHVGGLLAVPGLGIGKDDREVDKLQRGSDEVIVISNLLDTLVGHVVTDKGTARESTHELAELGHPWGRFVVEGGGLLKETLVVAVEDLLSAGEVHSQSLASEQSVETLAVIDVGLAIQEDPVGLSEKLVCGIHNTGLDVGGRVEDLPGHITSRGNHDEPAEALLVEIFKIPGASEISGQKLYQGHSLVEDRDTAKGSTVPFGLVLSELRVD